MFTKGKKATIDQSTENITATNSVLYLTVRDNMTGRFLWMCCYHLWTIID